MPLPTTSARACYPLASGAVCDAPGVAGLDAALKTRLGVSCAKVTAGPFPIDVAGTSWVKCCYDVDIATGCM